VIMPVRRAGGLNISGRFRRKRDEFLVSVADRMDEAKRKRDADAKDLQDAQRRAGEAKVIAESQPAQEKNQPKQFFPFGKKGTETMHILQGNQPIYDETGKMIDIKDKEGNSVMDKYTTDELGLVRNLAIAGSSGLGIGGFGRTATTTAAQLGYDKVGFHQHNIGILEDLLSKSKNPEKIANLFKMLENEQMALGFAKGNLRVASQTKIPVVAEKAAPYIDDGVKGVVNSADDIRSLLGIDKTGFSVVDDVNRNIVMSSKAGNIVNRGLVKSFAGINKLPLAWTILGSVAFGAFAVKALLESMGVAHIAAKESYESIGIVGREYYQTDDPEMWNKALEALNDISVEDIGKSANVPLVGAIKEGDTAIENNAIALQMWKDLFTYQIDAHNNGTGVDGIQNQIAADWLAARNAAVDYYQSPEKVQERVEETAMKQEAESEVFNLKAKELALWKRDFYERWDEDHYRKLVEQAHKDIDDYYKRMAKLHEKYGIKKSFVGQRNRTRRNITQTTTQAPGSQQTFGLN